MAYFKLKINSAFDTYRGDYIGQALTVIKNCLAGSHTSASTLGTLSGERANMFDNNNSLVINDTAHRQTKHAGDLWSDSTNPTSTSSVYNLKEVSSYSYSSNNYCHLEFYKKHYMNNNISGASTTTSFTPYVRFRLGWRVNYGWSFICTNTSATPHVPVGSGGFTSTGRYPTPNGSSLTIGTSEWNELDEIHIWQSETFFAIALYHQAGTVSTSTINSGKNLFFYWGDFPYIDAVDGYHYGRNSNYYPGCWQAIAMGNHDVRNKNHSPGTSDYQMFGVGRFGAVTGKNEYFNHPSPNTTNYLNTAVVGTGYAQYAQMWPHPLTPRTPIPTANGTGPFMIPCQFNGGPMLGRDESTSVPTTAGTLAASAQNFGDARAGQMLGLYVIPDEFGNAPGDRFKVGDEFYRTVWTHKKGGSYYTFLDIDNADTAVYALPEKSQVGPDAI